MYIHPRFTMQLKPTWRPFLLADMAICNEFGSRCQFGYYIWGLQESQIVLLGTQVRVPRKTVSNNVKYSLFGVKNTFEDWYVCVAVWGDTMPMK